MLGEITTIFLEEKLPNVRLTFHMGQHSSALAVCCGCDATDSLTARKFIGKQKKTCMVFVISVGRRGNSK